MLVADLGNVRCGAELNDSYAALQIVLADLLNLNKQERDDFFDVYALAEDRIHREACLKEMMENDEALGLYDDSAR